MITQVEPSDAARRLKETPDEVLLLDVREPYERSFARIEPSLHIPMAELPQRVQELPMDREIVVYCHVGIRSAIVAGYLDAVGFPRVSNLVGGIDRWSLEADHRVPRYV